MAPSETTSHVAPTATEPSGEAFARTLADSPTDLAKLVRRVDRSGRRVVAVSASAVTRWNRDDPASWERVRDWLAARGVRVIET